MFLAGRCLLARGIGHNPFLCALTPDNVSSVLFVIAARSASERRSCTEMRDSTELLHLSERLATADFQVPLSTGMTVARTRGVALARRAPRSHAASFQINKLRERKNSAERDSVLVRLAPHSGTTGTGKEYARCSVQSPNHA